MKLEKTIIYTLISELLFTILPLLIILIINCYNQKYELFLFNNEWSIMTIILYGQSIVKFSSGISNSKEKIKWQLVALIISVLIIFGLIPSIILLIINIQIETKSFTPYIIQIILFILSVIAYFIIGYLGQKMLDEK